MLGPVAADWFWLAWSPPPGAADRSRSRAAPGRVRLEVGERVGAGAPAPISVIG